MPLPPPGVSVLAVAKTDLYSGGQMDLVDLSKIMRTFVPAVILGVFCGLSVAEEDPLATPEMKKQAPGAVELGWRYFKRGDLDTAFRRFEMAARHDKDYAPAYYGVAYVYSVRGDLDKAIKNYRMTLKLDPRHLYANANLGYALLQKDEDAEALKYLDKALGLDPKCGEAHLSYANYHAKHEQWEKAGTSANKAISLKQQIHPEFRKLLESHGVKLAKPAQAAPEQPARRSGSK
jgi:Tfp pilus assembly protein PilF